MDSENNRESINDEDPATFTYRDNYLEFKNKAGGKAKLFKDSKGNFGCFSVKDYCVTEGQNPDRYIRDDDNYYLVNNHLYFRCGRQKTEKVVKWWKKEYPMGFSTYDCDYGSLNFAMRGNLRLNLTGMTYGYEKAFAVLKDIGIAQGN